MRVLHLSVHFSPNIGGVETHLNDLVFETAKRKHSVFVLTYRPLVAKVYWKMIERFAGVTIFRIPWLPGLFYYLHTKPILEFLYLIPGLFFITPIVLLLFNPDVIHSHGLIGGFIGVFWSKLFRKRVVVSTHSLYHFPSNGLYYRFVHWIFTNADKVLCLSRQSKTEIKKLGISENKTSLFTYWVDINIFKPLDRNKIKKKLGWEDKFIILFVGRLVPEKGVLELLEASESAEYNVRYLIIGDGPLAEEIKKAANKNNKIIFINKIDNKDLPEYYNAADYVIVPSTHDEGFGRVILESLASGTPVIASNRGAIPEAMDKSVGILLDITPKNIIETVKKLNHDIERRNKFARNAREFALAHYTALNCNLIISTYN